MKRFLLSAAATALISGSASAADLPRRAEPPPVFTPVPVFTWTGVYIGTHTTYTFTDKQRITTVGNDPFAQYYLIGAGFVPAAVSSKSTDGFANFGGGFGINYQFTPGSGFVVGAAIDADWTDVHKNTLVFNTPFYGVPGGNIYSQELGWLATMNGRVGYAFDRFLIYGTGGAAIGHVKYGHSVFMGGFLVGSGGDGANEVGYNYGGGIEYAIPQDSFLGNLNLLKLIGINLGGTTTIKAEYIHYDLGSRSVLVSDFPNINTSLTTRFKTEGNMVRAGFSYKFP